MKNYFLKTAVKAATPFTFLASSFLFNGCFSDKNESHFDELNNNMLKKAEKVVTLPTQRFDGQFTNGERFENTPARSNLEDAESIALDLLRGTGMRTYDAQFLTDKTKLDELLSQKISPTRNSKITYDYDRNAIHVNSVSTHSGIFHNSYIFARRELDSNSITFWKDNGDLTDGIISWKKDQDGNVLTMSMLSKEPSVSANKYHLQTQEFLRDKDGELIQENNYRAKFSDLSDFLADSSSADFKEFLRGSVDVIAHKNYVSEEGDTLIQISWHQKHNDFTISEYGAPAIIIDGKLTDVGRPLINNKAILDSNMIQHIGGKIFLDEEIYNSNEFVTKNADELRSVEYGGNGEIISFSLRPTNTKNLFGTYNYEYGDSKSIPETVENVLKNFYDGKISEKNVFEIDLLEIRRTEVIQGYERTTTFTRGGSLTEEYVLGDYELSPLFAENSMKEELVKTLVEDSETSTKRVVAYYFELGSSGIMARVWGTSRNYVSEDDKFPIIQNPDKFYSKVDIFHPNGRIQRLYDLTHSQHMHSPELKGRK